MNIKARIASLFLSESWHLLQAEAAAYREARKRLPALLAPGSDTLAEMDSQYLDLIARHSDDEVLFGSFSSHYQPTEQQRVNTVYRARNAILLDPNSDSIIRMWQNFAFGFNIEVIPKDENEQPVTLMSAKDTIKDYFESQRNRAIFGTREVSDLNDILLTDGEIFFLNFTDTFTGLTQTRLIPTEEIPADGIVCDPNDRRKPLYYKRQYKNASGGLDVVYYRDWLASDEDLEAIAPPANVFDTPGTIANVIHLAFNRKVKASLRGWPLLTSAMDWTLAYKENLQDQAAVARAVAMTVNKMKVKGGSRAVDVFKSRFGSSLTQGTGAFETNPSATPGSTLVHNESVDLQRMPMNTGAADAAITSAAILSVALNGTGNLPLDWFGRGDVNTYAQANSANIPAFRNFNRYQLVWSSAWSDLSENALRQYERFNPVVKFDTYESTVNLDNPLQPEPSETMAAITAFVRDVYPILPGEISGRVLISVAQVALQVFGIQDVSELTELPEETTESNINILNGAQITAVLEILSSIQQGAITPEAVYELLVVTGIDEARARRIVDDITNNLTSVQAIENYRNGTTSKEDMLSFLSEL